MFLTGSPDAPVQRVQGRVFDKGALTRDSIVNLDNTVFWVGDDGIVYRGEGTPQRISDHGIEDRIAHSAKASAWAYALNGHLFYVLQLDIETLVYDAATQLWHEAGSGEVKWRGAVGITVGREVIAGDGETGALWTLTDGVYRDADDELTRLFTVQVNERGFLDNLSLDCATGEQADPNTPQGLFELRTSRDGGMQWTDWRQSGTGAQGRYRQPVTWRRLGLVDRGDMLIQVRITDPAASRVSNVRINDTNAGRSR